MKCKDLNLKLCLACRVGMYIDCHANYWNEQLSEMDNNDIKKLLVKISKIHNPFIKTEDPWYYYLCGVAKRLYPDKAKLMEKLLLLI